MATDAAAFRAALAALSEDDLRKLPPEDLTAILERLDADDRDLKFNALAHFKPYPKQAEFLAMGARKTERLMMAGNRVGKTFCGAAELAYHLTGRYPDWWKGRKFTRAIKAWAANDTSLNTRDIVQSKLCGPYGVVNMQGTGAIPRECVDWNKDTSLARGVTDSYDTVLVKHTSGAQSILTFKSYEQGRKKWQGEAVDVIWFDEEAPEDIYAEGIARLAPVTKGEKSGLAYTTFTPLQGMTNVVRLFTDQESPDRGVIYMTLDEAEHIDPEEKQRRLAAYLPHEREARSRGVPLLGSGRVFQVAEEVIAEDRLFSVPNHWPKLWGIDFGIGHPFGAALLAWDRDADVVHVLHAFRMRDGRPLDHVRAMRPFGDIAVAYPRDGAVRDKGSGISLAKLYKDEGAWMLHEHAQHPDGNISTEKGIADMYTRMTTGRFKVALHLADWWEEFRTYHRKDGQLVKQNDDIMSATRHGVMMLRFAKVSGRPLRSTLDVNNAAATRLAANADLDGRDLF
jgi:phage terminase large subunit-like protein